MTVIVTMRKQPLVGWFSFEYYSSQLVTKLFDFPTLYNKSVKQEMKVSSVIGVQFVIVLKVLFSLSA